MPQDATTPDVNPLDSLITSRTDFFEIGENEVHFPGFGYDSWICKGKFTFDNDHVVTGIEYNQREGGTRFFSSPYPYEMKHPFDLDYGLNVYNKLAAYNYRPLDALQALKDGYGHIILQHQTATTPVLSVIYLLDEPHKAQLLRHKIIAEWNQLLFGYAVGFVLNDVFYDKHGDKILKYQDPGLIDKLFETEDQAWGYASSVADKACRFADSHPELFYLSEDTPSDKQETLYADLAKQPRVILPALNLMNYQRHDEDKPEDMFQQGKGLRIVQVAYPAY